MDHPKPLSILVADDTESSLAVICSMLEAQGYHAIKARNGQEAVDLASARPPDTILMDIIMPELDGLSAIRALRQIPSTSETPILVLSALATTEDIVAGLEAGADDYLTKPVNFSILQAKLRLISRLIKSPG